MTNTDATALREVIFIDSRVQDPATLLKGFPPGAEVVLLNSGDDGLAQMVAALGQQGDVGSVHVLAHGSAGQLWLGTTFLGLGTLAGQAEALAALGQGLTADGDLLVYACDLAQGEVGAQFVTRLAELTGADVAASDDRTGAGGDWDLEVSTGDIAGHGALHHAALAEYGAALQTYTVTNTSDSGFGSLRQALIDANSAGGADTIQFAAGLNGTITLLSDVAVIEDVTLDLSAASGVTLTGSSLAIGAGATLTVLNGAGNTATIATALSGTGALAKTGAGALTLSGSNGSHTGSVSVNAGTLNIIGGQAIGDTSAVSVQSGGTLALVGGSETIVHWRAPDRCRSATPSRWAATTPARCFQGSSPRPTPVASSRSATAR